MADLGGRSQDYQFLLVTATLLPLWVSASYSRHKQGFYSSEKLEVRSSSLEVSSMPCASLSFPARFAQLKLESYDSCDYSRVANSVLGYRVELLVLQGAPWSLSSVHPAKKCYSPRMLCLCLEGHTQLSLKGLC